MSREALIANPPFHLTPVDIATLRQNDDEWEYYTWDFLKDVIAERNALDTLTRLPSHLENYIHFNNYVKQTYGSMLNFLMQHKIGWIPKSVAPADIPALLPLKPTSMIPFASPEDYRIVRNDWPYGTFPENKHLVVWLKSRIPVNEDGDPTAESRALIDDFVDTTFRSNVKEGTEIMWFKNRTAWQSVRALEHIHVLVRGAEEALIEAWTGQTEADMEANKWKDGRRVAD
ncbi:hypothetical protein EJ05DRAFT_501065 [Pseudovirgaria hyperparasitica]|uniref:N-acetylglucosamine-induced protein 1 n=1 Tax=Pseudovirgaria hyperparasitica TaxID=470096 RepID=A0A6A6W679_9PEZI|nr:uncharacterized protein EJ05DRAFT_501065 [Pseudovirgaria hyperparasitica]KAF2757534.1 hypothetical protein EJ05DRAFT_501065 [Pseudovirgaria hyperparasitica]